MALQYKYICYVSPEEQTNERMYNFIIIDGRFDSIIYQVLNTAAQLSEVIGYTLGISISATKPKVRETPGTAKQNEKKSKPRSSKPVNRQESRVSFYFWY